MCHLCNRINLHAGYDEEPEIYSPETPASRRHAYEYQIKRLESFSEEARRAEAQGDLKRAQEFRKAEERVRRILDGKFSSRFSRGEG